MYGGIVCRYINNNSFLVLNLTKKILLVLIVSFLYFIHRKTQTKSIVDNTVYSLRY